MRSSTLGNGDLKKVQVWTATGFRESCLAVDCGTGESGPLGGGRSAVREYYLTNGSISLTPDLETLNCD